MQMDSIDQKMNQANNKFNRVEKVHSLQFGQSVESQLTTLTDQYTQIHTKLDQTESAVYEFRRESFTNLNEVEKIFLKKNDIIRRAVADICKQLDVTNPLMTIL